MALQSATHTPLTPGRRELADRDVDDGDGLELTLGLAIGGIARKAPNPRGSDSAGDRRRMPDEEEGRRKDGRFGGLRGPSAEDIAAMEAQMRQSRARDRAVREAEAFSDDRWRSNCTDGGNGARWPWVAPTPNPNPNTNPFGHQAFPVMYPYHQVQYVAAPNGFLFPCVMSCWAPTISAVPDGLHRSERNVYQPVACCGLSVPDNADLNGDKGVEGAEVGNISLKTDSTGSSSSGISDHRSISLRGGSISSSDSRSNSSPQKAEEEKPAAASSEEGANKLASSAAQPCMLSDTTGALKRAPSLNKPVAVARERRNAGNWPPLPRVSTTGDGPSGRTVTGFLYRCNKSEVSIVCVCHGSSFTPAEFVKHAGGTNISQPLRQIVMIPS